jgi:hypothetical protein
MTALAANRPIPRVNDPDTVLFPVLAASVLTLVHLYAGAMVSLDATGANLVDATSSTGPVVGVLRKEINNTGTTTVTGAEYMIGPFPMNSGAGVDAVTAVNMFQDVYVIDDNTVGLTDGGVGRPRAGYVCGFLGSQPIVMIGVANPNAVAPGGTSLSATTAFTARMVMTSLAAAYVGSGTTTLTAAATGVIGAQDGVTPALNDVMFIQEGTTNIIAAKDAGPWQVTTLGAVGVKYVLTRPSWWTTGESIVPAKRIEIDGEGTVFASSEWKSFVAKGKVIGTDAPVFWPRQITTSVVLVAGTAAAITTLPIRSATQSMVTFLRILLGGTPGPAGYAVVPAMTPGVTGTASLVPMAIVDAGTISNLDTSTINITVTNY